MSHTKALNFTETHLMNWERFEHAIRKRWHHRFNSIHNIYSVTIDKRRANPVGKLWGGSATNQPSVWWFNFQLRIEVLSLGNKMPRITRGPWHFISQWKRKNVLLSLYIYLHLAIKLNYLSKHDKSAVSTLDQLSRDPCLFHWVL